MKRKTFTDFLTEKTSSMRVGNTTWIKGIPFPIADEVELFAVPIYNQYAPNSSTGQQWEKQGVPDAFRINGYWVPDKMIYIMVGHIDIESIELATSDCIRLVDFYDFMNEIKKAINCRICSWIKENSDKIEPSEFQERRVAEDFNSGHQTVDVNEETEHCMQRIERDIKEKSLDVMLYLSGNNSEIEKTVKSCCDVLHNAIAIAKANRNELECRVKNITDSDTPRGRARKIKSIFVEQLAKGAKNCKATFDFGYATVTKQINMNLPYAWIENTDKATRAFQKKYCQPVTMSYVGAQKEDFLAYIVCIEIRGKKIYETTPMPYVPENRFYNALFNEDYNRAVNVDDYKDEKLDCSVRLHSGCNIICSYVKRYYSTVETVRFLVEHGASAREAYEMMEKESDSRSGYGARGNSHDWDRIKEYLKSVLE